ncbi:MAG: transposase [Bacteroidota bacterium]
MKKLANSIDDSEIIKVLEQLRWGKEAECPYCSCNKIKDYVVENKFQCENCFRSFSVFSKTEFENTKLPLETWLLAYYLITENKQMHPTNLNKWLNVTQKTSSTIYGKIVKMISEKNWFNKISESSLYRNQFAKYYIN